MSRSKRHSPYVPVTCCESEKDDKRLANRRLRRNVREAVRNGAEVFPTMDEIYDHCNGSKDGLQRITSDNYKWWMK